MDASKVSFLEFYSLVYMYMRSSNSAIRKAFIIFDYAEANLFTLVKVENRTSKLGLLTKMIPLILEVLLVVILPITQSCVNTPYPLCLLK
jgi:hypothetical protein